MNNTYNLKYSSHSGGLVAVSELCCRKGKSPKRNVLSRLLLALALTGLMPASVLAAVVGSHVDYQTYRDFAENKGRFAPGSVNIPVYSKDGRLIGRLNQAPMPDFSSVANAGLATLVHPQYVVSVKHNGSYPLVRFGDGQNSYRPVDYNNHPLTNTDFHIPRLNKLVTEVAAFATSNIRLNPSVYTDRNRFPVFYRVGGGEQFLSRERLVTGDSSRVSLERFYEYLVGGTVNPPQFSGESIISTPGGLLHHAVENGDSGSPLFAWDTTEGQWVLVGVLIGHTTSGPYIMRWKTVDLAYSVARILEDNDPAVNFTSGKGPLRWSFNSASGTGELTQTDHAFAMHGRKGDDLNAGKNLLFRGENGEVVLNNSIDQGAGSLIFQNNYTLSAVSNQTWVGGGVNIQKDVTVDWRINGKRGDNLHKIGEGTLLVNAKGINPGGLKVGDGTVILRQNPDDSGSIQAFSHINLASGRATVKLDGINQVNPDRITWSARGGTLEINGHNLAFQRILAQDAGARISNSSGTKSQITITPLTDPARGLPIEVRSYEAALVSNKWKPGDLYERNGTAGKEYFIQKSFLFPVLPADRTSNAHWEYVGTDKARAIALVKSGQPEDHYIFHGNISGNIDTRIDPSYIGGNIVFDGNINTPDGMLSQQGKALTLQGHPVIHAYNSGRVIREGILNGENSIKTQPVSFDQPDWEARSFVLRELSLNETQFSIARNASVTANISATDGNINIGNPQLYIDLHDGEALKGNGKLDQYVISGVSVAGNMDDKGRLLGNINATNAPVNVWGQWRGNFTARNSQLDINGGQVTLTGFSQIKNSPINLHGNAHLTATGGWDTDRAVNVSDNAILTLAASDKNNFNEAGLTTVNYQSQGINLRGNSSRLAVLIGSEVQGNIFATGSASINMGHFSTMKAISDGLFSGFSNVYRGAIDAPAAKMAAYNSQWFLSGTSGLSDLTMSSSSLIFSGQTISGTALTATEWKPHNLNVNSASISHSQFTLTTDPLTARGDQLMIAGNAPGSSNRLVVKYLNNQPLTEAREQLLISAGRNVTANFISDIDTPQTGSYQNAIGLINSGAGKQWWLMSMTADAPWKLTGSRQFESLNFTHGGHVRLSDPKADNWTPRVLTVNHLTATGVNFHLSSHLHSMESDHIIIRNMADGDNNTLNVSMLVNDAAPADSRALLASAPASTADSYFTVKPVLSGLNLYFPNTRIVSTENRKQWQLTSGDGRETLTLIMEELPVPEVTAVTEESVVRINDAPTPAVAANARPASQPELQPVADTPVLVAPSVAETAASSNSAPQPGTSLFRRLDIKLSDLGNVTSPEQISILLRQKGIAADDLRIGQYQQAIQETVQMVQKVENLVTTPQISFILETNQLNKRLGDVRQLGEDHGLWIKTSAGRAQYHGMNMHHNTIQLGMDKKAGDHLYGIMGSYSRGSSSGADLNEQHTTGGVGLYYSYIPEQGVFFDIIGKYLKNHHNYRFPEQSTIGSHSPRSTTLLGSVQVGYHAKFSDGRLFVEPSVEILSGRTSGYNLPGRDIRVQVNSSAPVYSKTGLAAGINWQTQPQQQLSLAAGLFRLQNLQNNGGVELFDNSGSSRQRGADKDSRYLASLSVNARLSPDWRIYAQAETSFGGQIKGDYSGQLGLRFQF